MRLSLRDEVKAVLGYLDALQESLLAQAEGNLETVMPGYTHLQTAQPILFAHHMLAYYEMFRRDAFFAYEGSRSDGPFAKPLDYRNNFV